MRRATESLRRLGRAVGVAAAAALCTLAWGQTPNTTQPTQRVGECKQPVYLTFDTGHMGVAPLVAQVLRRQQVLVTFFMANERTLTGGSSLDDQWAPWWRDRADEGHAFGSHTWDHEVWQADAPDGLVLKPTMGPQAGRRHKVSAAQYCQSLEKTAQRWSDMMGSGSARQTMGRIFRAPAGKTSPALIEAARGCGYTHVGWSAAGFLGDELSSDRYPNEMLLRRALRDIRAGDILVAHLGIWSRQDPWAPAVLEPLIEGLKRRGMCFATLRDHPKFGQAARTAAVTAPALAFLHGHVD